MKKKKSGSRGKFVEWLTQEGLIKIEGWARDGLTNEQIAKNIGVNPDTLYTWIKKYPEISETLKRGKEVVDRQVENALLKRALGYRYEEVTHVPVLNPETGKFEMAPDKIVTKEVQPDVTAQIFWLKNRKPADWRDKRDVEHSGEIMNKVMDLSHLSDEDLQKELNKYGDG